MNPQPLLEKSPPPARLSGRMQLVTLLVRKELLLKLRRPMITVFEILFPVALCAILIAGSMAAETKHYNATSVAPEDFDAVLGSLGPQVVLPLLVEGGALGTSAAASGLPSIPTPGAIPPLGLFLLYANVATICSRSSPLSGLEVAPADGSALAVAHPVETATRVSCGRTRWPAWWLERHGTPLRESHDHRLWRGALTSPTALSTTSPLRPSPPLFTAPPPPSSTAPANRSRPPPVSTTPPGGA